MCYWLLDEREVQCMWNWEYLYKYILLPLLRTELQVNYLESESDSLFHPSLVSQMSGLWTRMELRRCIRPSIRLWMFDILSPFKRWKNIPQAAVRQELFAKFHEVIGSTGVHSWCLWWVATCFCLHVQMVLLLVHYFTMRRMFSSFSWQFSWSHQLFCFKKSSKHGFSGGRYRESISLGFTRLSKAEVPAGKDLAAHRSTVIELHPFIWEMVG